MKAMKLTVAEITELQPTAVSYAGERGMVVGGLECSGDIDHEAVEAAAHKHFGAAARLDDGEACDGEDCTHYVVLSAEVTQCRTR